MLLLLKENTTQIQAQELIDKLSWMRMQGIPAEENGRFTIAVVTGTDELIDFKQFLSLPYVDAVLPFKQKFKLAGREFKKERTIIDIKGVKIGGDTLAVMAGPCSIESEAQMHTVAAQVAKSGANILRGGAFKPRSSPYDFQGLGEEGLRYMRDAARANSLLCISELMDADDIDLLVEYVDIIQIGARNMQNFSLLKHLGKIKTPIMLKRGLSATYSEFLMATEYILQGGNANVMLCERGIRTFETYTRNTLDLAAVPILHELSHLPVIIDPSHGTGIRKMVPPMACAAVAAGADGIMVEVHPEPDKSVSDANQTISPDAFATMMQSLRPIGQAIGKIVK